MAGSLITSTDISAKLTSEYPVTGKSIRRVWWNSAESRWDGIFLDSSSDYFIWHDVDGTNAIQSIKQLEDRSAALATAGAVEI